MFGNVRVMPKQGRPPGLLANPDAFAEFLEGRSQRWLADASGMSTAHLSEVLSGRKGVSAEQATRLAEILHRRPGALFPQLAIFKVETRVFAITGVGEAA